MIIDGTYAISILQVVEIEELKTRLKQRSVIEVNNLKDKKETLNKISVKIKNAEDDLNNYDEEVSPANFILMKYYKIFVLL